MYEGRATRNRRSLVTVGLIVVAVAACSGEWFDTAEVPLTNIISGGPGGTWYAIGSAIADRSNNHFHGHPITAVPGAGAISNPARVARVPGDMGMSYLHLVRAAYRGRPPYPEAFAELRLIAVLTENKLHLLVSDDLQLRSLRDLADIRGVRIGTGTPGSNEEYVMRILLEESGLSYDAIREQGGRINLLGTSERVGSWKDRHLDIINFTINDPAPAVSELMIARPSRIWSLPAELREAVVRKHGYRATVIPSNTYPGQGEPVETIGDVAVLFGTVDLDEEIVYAVTKTIAENKPYLITVHPSFADWDPNLIPQDPGLPYHRGSARYYRERGWLPPEGP
jgi:uncharacterized protein